MLVKESGKLLLETEMTKVLMIQDSISHYNVAAFNQINKEVDFTLLYKRGNVPYNVQFKTIKKSKYNIEEIKDYDVLICSPNFQNIDLLKLIRKFGRKKSIYYGIGVSASYTHPYDGNKFVGLFFSVFLRWIGAAIFYSNYPKEKYKKLGVNNDKLFVANNTTEVEKIEMNSNKENILFVGSLYSEKGLDVLLEEYNEAYKENINIPNLLIVGDGEEKENINKYIYNNGLENKISLLGAIYNEHELSKLFQSSIACISPKQAGLTVLKSMGYGVPFITCESAITGGELFNINKNNGIIYKNQSELKSIILTMNENKKVYLDLGKNAYDYYYSHCTIKNMSDGFIEAIRYICY